jgi:hypothetical protein
MVMANLDFGTTAVVEPNNTKRDTAVRFEKLFADDVSLQRALSSAGGLQLQDLQKRHA